MSLPSDTCKHRPVVGNHSPGVHYLICGECGLLLDFRPLEEMGVKTNDWRSLPDITEVARPTEAQDLC